MQKSKHVSNLWSHHAGFHFFGQRHRVGKYSLPKEVIRVIEGGGRIVLNNNLIDHRWEINKMRTERGWVCRSHRTLKGQEEQKWEERILSALLPS